MKEFRDTGDVNEVPLSSFVSIQRLSCKATCKMLSLDDWKIYLIRMVYNKIIISLRDINCAILCCTRTIAYMYGINTDIEVFL